MWDVWDVLRSLNINSKHNNISFFDSNFKSRIECIYNYIYHSV